MTAFKPRLGHRSFGGRTTRAKSIAITGVALLILFLIILILTELEVQKKSPIGTFSFIALAVLQLILAVYVAVRAEAGPPTIHPEATYVTGNLGRQNVNPSALQEFIRGREARDENRLKSARRHFERATTVQSDYWEALYERAHIDRRLRRYEDAIGTLKDIISRCPVPEEVRLSHGELAMCYRDLGNHQEAHEEFEIAYEDCQNRDENPVPLANMVISSYAIGEFEQGETLRGKLAKHPSFLKVRDAVEAELKTMQGLTS